MCRYLNCIIFIDDRFFSDSLSLNTGFAPNLKSKHRFYSVCKIYNISCTSNKQKYNWQFNGEIKSTERNQKQIMTKLHNKKIYFGNFLIKNKSRIFIQILNENDGK